MNGLLLVKKEINMTSRDVVNQVGKFLHTRKIGHTGTLDPLATGVMVLCIGSATSLVELITADTKEYIAEVLLGVETDTGDITGDVLQRQDTFCTKEQIELACLKLTGTYEQTVPIYSAIKIAGKKLYEYAREGHQVELPKRKVTVFRLELLDSPVLINNQVRFRIRCVVSKGTYIRSLIHDLAYLLGTIGTMLNLIRTRQGDYTLDQCYTLSQIESGKFTLEDPETIYRRYPVITVKPELEQKIKNGCLLENVYASKVVLFQNQEGILLALYHVYEKDFTKIKPWKMIIK